MRVLLLGALLAAGCSGLQEPPAPPFRVAITVEADKGIALAGAVVSRSSKEVGRTDATGKAILTFRGEEGDQLEVWIKCPEGYESPIRPTTITLRRLSDPQKFAEYPVACPPSERKVVVALRAENGGNLSVKFLNRELARTDSSGASTFLLNAKSGDKLDFVIDTSDKSNEMLRPQNPTISVVVDSKDAIYTIDQPFQVQKKRVVVMGPSRPQPIGPTPLRY